MIRKVYINKTPNIPSSGIFMNSSQQTMSMGIPFEKEIIQFKDNIFNFLYWVKTMREIDLIFEKDNKKEIFLIFINQYDFELSGDDIIKVFKKKYTKSQLNYIIFGHGFSLMGLNGMEDVTIKYNRLEKLNNILKIKNND
jgi:hypothetical protein